MPRKSPRGCAGDPSCTTQAAVGNPLAGAFIGAVAGAIAGEVTNFFFGDLFGGGSPPIPRQLRHQRHPLYKAILGVPDGLIPDEMSEGAPPIYGDPFLRNLPPPISKNNGDLLGGFTKQDGVCTVQNLLCGKALNNKACTLACCQTHDNCYTQNQCNYSPWLTEFGCGYLSDSCHACNAAVVNCIKGCL